MMSWQMVLVVIAALLSGALMVLILEASATMRAMRKQLKQTATKGQESLRNLDELIGKLNDVTDQLSGTRMVIQAAITAIGPAVRGFVRTMQDDAHGQNAPKTASGNKTVDNQSPVQAPVSAHRTHY